MSKITREEGVAALAQAQKDLEASSSKEQVLAVLKEAGTKVGYAPAFRCLVSGSEPEQSIRWS